MATVIKAKRKPRKKSVLKAIRQSVRRAEVNRSHRSQLRRQIKRFRAALEKGDPNGARPLLQATLSLIDRAIQKRTLHPNTAARTKSRLQLRFNSLLSGSRPASSTA